MNQTCEYRLPEPAPRTGYKCAEGLNFAYVGPNLEVCRACPVPRLLTTPRCWRLDIIPYLEWQGTVPVIAVLFYCTRGQRNVDSLVDCQGCPAYEPSSLLGSTALGASPDANTATRR